MRPLLLALLMTLPFGCPALAAPKVVVSIAPLHSLVSNLMRNVGSPQLLLPQGGSPHSSSLRPSQAMALSEADLLIWVGPQLEAFLERPIARLVRPGAALGLMQLNGLKKLTQREGGFWAEENSVDHTHEDPSGSGINPHIWLSPVNAQRIAAQICARLVLLDPPNRTAYELNLRHLKRRIQWLEKQLNGELEPLRGRPYLVFHDAYHYFERAFSMRAVGSIRISAERAPGARRLQQIRSKINRSGALCLFSEPQFNPDLAKKLAQDSGLASGVLDPLGKASVPADDAWFILMRDLASNLRNCLEKETQ